ncbi:hypothetical protein M2323_000358 [Rhodoblastus acidophilus]|uniref:hypothetical protein n=1 Tax=Rhodoblastus acidophilus TaxID=1074 RepID=UPI0022245F56|nr:hypothetical protein [Rhodoblastus acidophilus]MCW2282597.1 hypothetical protein [Rhodoblastus acidophilus]MCW2331458.1 hypothetical protein [Rhodoblastus acidophilus]
MAGAGGLAALTATEMERLSAFLSVVERISDSSFYKIIPQMRYTLIVEHVRTAAGVQRRTWFSHPVFRIEDFESLCVRIRPLLYDRDAASFVKKIVPIAEKILHTDTLKQELRRIVAHFDATDIKKEVTSLVAWKQVSDQELTINRWQVIFGGNMWLTEELYDDLFLYGMLYHWNENGEKWKKYQEIEKAAGSYEAVVRCSIPFLARKVSAARRLHDLICEAGIKPALNGTPPAQENSSGGAIEHQDGPVTSMNVPSPQAELPCDTIDPLMLIWNSPEGSFIREYYTLPMDKPDLKFTITLEARGVAPPQPNGQRFKYIPSLRYVQMIQPGTKTELDYEVAPDQACEERH